MNDYKMARMVEVGMLSGECMDNFLVLINSKYSFSF